MKNYIFSYTLISLLSLNSAFAASHSGNRMIDTYDQNGDGVLTQDEFEAARIERFNKTDRNNNKTVDVEEYVAEYEVRLLRQIEEDRKRSVKQAHVRFNILDKDKNGALEWDEINTTGDRIFKSYDTNKDGVISKDDPKVDWAAKYKNHKKKKGEKSAEKTGKKAPKKVERRRSHLRGPSTHSFDGVLKLYDTNGDNKVTRAELTAKRKSDFLGKDKNKNGSLSEREYVGDFEDILDGRAKNVRKMQLKQTYVRFDALDKDKNKVMELEEFLASGKRFFARYDTNNDGALTSADPAPKPRPESHKKDTAKKRQKSK